MPTKNTPKTYLLSERSQELSSLIKSVSRAKRIVVVTGAGISVSSGIPDFRSSSGLFQQIQDAHADTISSGRSLFDSSVVFRTRETTAVFNQWMSRLHSKFAHSAPGTVHAFIKQLSDRGSLVRCYTQNIDGLERKAGLDVWDPYVDASWKSAHVVPLHGSMDHLTCPLCAAIYAFDELRPGDACPDCSHRSEVRELLGRRALATGTLRPTVVLYEEPHPHSEEIARIIAHDSRRTGCVVLVVGTTLKVPGCRRLVRQLAKSATTTVVVNREPVCGKTWAGVVDYQVVGDAEDWCAKIAHQWNAQTKITDWARTRKTSSLVSSQKKCTKRVVSSRESKPLATVEKTTSAKRVEVPRRSLRIALRRSVAESHAELESTSACA